MLEAVDIARSYGLRPALRGITLSVQPGEFVAVLGANGAGKTTLLRILATLARPDAGQLHIGGVDALQRPIAARRAVGLVSHQPLIYPDLSPAENLAFFARLYGVALSVIPDRLRRVGLHLRANDPARTLSRGMTQRLAIARALLHDPAVVLLDEPFTGLDQTSARNLSALLGEMAAAGRALVMTTHEFGRGLDGVTRGVIIRGGRIDAELTGDLSPDRLAALL